MVSWIIFEIYVIFFYVKFRKLSKSCVIKYQVSEKCKGYHKTKSANSGAKYAIKAQFLRQIICSGVENCFQILHQIIYIFWVYDTQFCDIMYATHKTNNRKNRQYCR